MPSSVSCSMTLPLSPSCSISLTSALSLFSLSIATAFSSVRPTTLGTLTLVSTGPLLTNKATVAPTAYCSPAAGCVFTTRPEAISSDHISLLTTINPAALSSLSATVPSFFTMSGIVAIFLPLLTVSVTVKPSLTDFPAA